jgi:23S rRNA-/tRNA-specific pseudouridylate synthase
MRKNILPLKRQVIGIQTLYKRLFSSETPPESTVLERWLQDWTATPPAAPLFDGAEQPTALSWARRRGPIKNPLSDATLHKLFRNEAIRVYDPSTGQVKRVKKTTPLPPGARLLFPQNTLVEEDTALSTPSSASIAAAKLLRDAVLFENEDMIAINKPPGFAVQGGSKINQGSSIDSLLPFAFPEQFSREYYSHLKLVHRLDKEVTGVLILGKGSQATARLAEAFRGKSLKATGAQPSGSSSSGKNNPLIRQPGVEKVYWAVVIDLSLNFGIKKESLGYLNAPITDSQNTTSAALTRYKVLQINKNSNAAWLELEPLTGRKHQLRQHCARELGLPILGDGKYGLVRKEPQKSLLEGISTFDSIDPTASKKKGDSVALFLHCRSIKLDIPGHKRKEIKIRAPVPDAWHRLFDQLGWNLPPPPPPR